jgi:hypothetical protein
MTGGRIHLPTRLMLGLPALVLATSCVPHAEPNKPGNTATIAIPPRQMLQRLALDVPRDVAESLPALEDAAMTSTATLAISAAPPFQGFAATRTPDDATRALDCLTAAIYYEARSQSDDGQRAVAQVVLNRVRDRAFPSSVCGVVYQGSTRATGCQFSFTCDGSMAYRRNERSWDHARTIAEQALQGAVYAPVGSATFYHANYVSPWWASSMDKVATIGAHIFYRWRSGLENALAFRQPYSGSEPGMAASFTANTRGSAAASPALYSGREMVGGVSIYRGLGTAIDTPAAAEAVASPDVATAAPAAQPKRERAVGGVRVHRGEESVGSASYSD